MNWIIKIQPHEIWDIIPQGTKRNWLGCILHHTALDNDGDQGIIIERLHREGLRENYPAFKYGMGYHFIISRSGAIEIGERWQKQLHGAHCIGKNQAYMGIALGGNLMIQQPTEPQLDNLFKVIAAMGINNIWPHNAFAKTLCPGDNCPVEFILKKSLLLNIKKPDLRTYKPPIREKEG